MIDEDIFKSKLKSLNYFIGDQNQTFFKKKYQEFSMIETRTFTAPRTMLLTERISYVSKQIVGWLRSLDEPFNFEKDQLKLAKFEHNAKGFAYHYVMVLHEDLSASDVSKSH